MIKALYRQEIANVQNCGKKPCFLQVELLAALERLLCFCHTGNTAVFTTSLMHPLCLSRAAIKDGFPMLLPSIFQRPRILSAMKDGFPVDARNWPAKGLYPAMASKRAQVLTYSLNHFLVSLFSPLQHYLTQVNCPRMGTYSHAGSLYD